MPFQKKIKNPEKLKESWLRGMSIQDLAFREGVTASAIYQHLRIDEMTVEERAEHAKNKILRNKE